MERSLLIDDQRTIYVDRVARTFVDGIKALTEEGPWDVLYLDHDLGEEKTGYDILTWLEQNMDKRPGKIVLVTSNIVGRDRMALALCSFYTQKSLWEYVAPPEQQT